MNQFAGLSDLDANQTPPLADIFMAAMAHPRLGEAAQALANNMLRLAADDPSLDAVFKDAGRYSAAMWAFHLHGEPEGLTLPRLKDLCARSGELSPGRARSLLQFLLHLGYIEPTGTGAGRATRYVPTAAFRDGWRAHFHAALEAAALLDPDISTLLDSLHDPCALANFATIHAQGLLAMLDSGPAAPLPFLRIFLHHHAGPHVTWMLITTDVSGAFPPQRTQPFSLSGVSRRFGVSRIHVRRIFEGAEREGLGRFEADGGFVIEEGTREQMRFLYAAQFVHLLVSAWGALRAARIAAAA